MVTWHRDKTIALLSHLGDRRASAAPRFELGDTTFGRLSKPLRSRSTGNVGRCRKTSGGGTRRPWLLIRGFMRSWPSLCETGNLLAQKGEQQFRECGMQSELQFQEKVPNRSHYLPRWSTKLNAVLLRKAKTHSFRILWYKKGKKGWIAVKWKSIDSVFRMWFPFLLWSLCFQQEATPKLTAQVTVDWFRLVVLQLLDASLFQHTCAY